MDPLAQLQDIHLPPQVNQYPIAIGWWLLAIIIIALIIVGVITLRRYKQCRKVKNQAIKQLTQHSDMKVEDILMLLKWAALHYFPRQQCANLYGKAFQQFLLDSLPEKMNKQKKDTFIQLLNDTTDSFNNVYQKNGKNLVDEKLKALALLWLNNALPVKNTNKSSNKSQKKNTNKHDEAVL